MTNFRVEEPIRILIGSVGRRIYLIDWFEEALENLGLQGEVHVTESDKYSAGYLRAKYHHLMPRYEDPIYESAMLDLFYQLRPHLFFSVNDYELNVLSTTGLAQRLRSLGGIVLALSAEKHAEVHDKLLMANALKACGIATPDTVLLSDTEALKSLTQPDEKFVVKDRYGSGSSGLLVVEPKNLTLTREWLVSNTPGLSLNSLVVQPAIEGPEYGVDIITSLDAKGDIHVLARKKRRMRSGETDQAETVSSEPFKQIASRIAEWTSHRGLIDVDIIINNQGELKVIDINPRFGGGYPFNHLAGANVPGYYVEQILRNMQSETKDHFGYKESFISSKFESIGGI